ncbi:MAG: hypothetical protein FWF22_09330 [Treponema sp.]|nr:hypothetical protein [Treponema sp.]
MMRSCPGAAWAKNPTITEKICPQCGREIELFSVDPYVKCECGFIAYNDLQSCLKWCAYARQCVGDEVYDQFMLKNSKEDKNNTKSE